MEDLMNPKEENCLIKEPSGLEHQVMKAMREVGKEQRDLMERRVNKTGVFRSQHHLLMGISRFPEISQKELAEMEHISGATVAVSLKKLEKGGYIERAADEHDSRCNHIRITEKGDGVVRESIQIFQSIETELLDGFSEDEKKRLLEYLTRIGQNIKKASKTEREGKKDEAL